MRQVRDAIAGDLDHTPLKQLLRRVETARGATAQPDALTYDI